MAINIVTKDVTEKFCKALGVNPSLVSAFQAHGGAMVVNGSNIVMSANGGAAKTLSVPAGALSLLYNQMMAHASKQSLLGQVMANMTALIKQADESGAPHVTFNKPITPFKEEPKQQTFTTKPPPSFTDGWGEDKPEPKASKPLGSTTLPPGPAATAATSVTVTAGVCDKDKINVLNPVKLSDAQYLLQPVKGSSAGSRYFCVAMSQTVKMAVRIVNHAMSLRVEWLGGKMGLKEYEQFIVNLKENGFDVKAASGYASLHLDCPNKAIALRTIGAMASGLKLPFLPEVIQSIL